MSDKKDLILNAALQLFAELGYDASSTNKIAKLAGVSEGLIFRHFTNKHGLLDALLDQMKDKVAAILGPIFMEEDPQKIVLMTIEVIFSISEEEYPYWRLQHMLKWNPNYYTPDKMSPFIAHLSGAMEKLGFSDPEHEAWYLWHALEGAGIANLRGQLQNDQKTSYKHFFLNKYTIN